MNIETKEWYATHNRVRAATDPVFFIENYINIAGFPLLLKPNVADFVYRLNRETEVTIPDLEQGEGMTQAILGYIVWKAHNRPGTTHMISSASMVDTMERLIHVAAMARSVSWEVGRGTVKKVGANIELENGSRIIGVSARTHDALRGHRCSTFVCDGFWRLPETQQSDLGYRLSLGILEGPDAQTILV